MSVISSHLSREMTAAAKQSNSASTKKCFKKLDGEKATYYGNKLFQKVGWAGEKATYYGNKWLYIYVNLQQLEIRLKTHRSE